MNWLRPILIFAVAFLAVFWESAFHGVRQLLGAQIDFLPPLMVYAALRSSLATVAALACLGGLWFDCLSANLPGVTILPLFGVGLFIHINREVVLRDEPFAQFVLGLGASAAVPLFTLLLLLTTGNKPLLGWGTLWQWIVMAAGGAIATPVGFVFFEWLERALIHGRMAESSFRPDREIRRGRR